MAVNLRNISDLVILIKFFIFTYQKLILVTTKHAQVAGALAVFSFGPWIFNEIKGEIGTSRTKDYMPGGAVWRIPTEG